MTDRRLTAESRVAFLSRSSEKRTPDRRLIRTSNIGSFISLLFPLLSLPGSCISARGGEGWGTWVKFCSVCDSGISGPLPHYSLFLVYFVANYKHHLSHFWANDFLTLKVPKKCDPILITLLKMLKRQPHYSQSSRENAISIQQHTPSSPILGSAPPPGISDTLIT